MDSNKYLSKSRWARSLISSFRRVLPLTGEQQSDAFLAKLVDDDDEEKKDKKKHVDDDKEEKKKH